jgi:hypothetical protein
VETKGLSGKGWSPPRPEVGCRAGEGREEKEIQRAVGKVAGDETRLYTEQSFGAGRLASSDAMPDAAGGEGGHGKTPMPLTRGPSEQGAIGLGLAFSQIVFALQLMES